MRTHSVIVLAYGLFLLAIAVLTAAVTGVDDPLDGWIVLATSAGGLFALLDDFASRFLGRVMPMFGVRIARIVLIFYAGLIGWLTWLSLQGGSEGGDVYHSVVLFLVFCLTLAITVWEFLVRAPGQEPGKARDESRRETVSPGRR